MGVVRGSEEVGKVDDAQLGHPFGEVAGREVAEGEPTGLHLLEQLARLATGVEDVVLDLDVHVRVLELPKQLRDPRQPTTVAGVRRAVATQPDGQPTMACAQAVPPVSCGDVRRAGILDHLVGRMLRFRYTEKYSDLQNMRE